MDIYLREALCALTGCMDYRLKREKAYLAEDLKKIPKIRSFVRAYEEEGRVYIGNRLNMSSVIGNLRECNCYIDIPAGATALKGDVVEIMR